MAKVLLNKGDSLEKALKKFKRQVEAEGILKECRDRMYYKSKGELRRERKKAARRKQIRERIKREKFDKLFD